ncbi:serine carboxypeptidase [Marasmius fiardii PR-910]|nr:serine carboxypeptidase [Marasmius fiardii PR-910]
MSTDSFLTMWPSTFSTVASLALLALPLSVLGGQFHAVNGVPNAARALAAEPRQSTDNVTTTPGALRVVENSGICETTPGVAQVSGYGDLSATESIFFWYFAARNNSSTAPLVLWFNGGPGSSSMIGLFQELGPCRINNDTTTVSLNPFSWNNDANVLFIDQPVGVGFSHGDLKVQTSQQAAADVWKFLQIFLKDERFSNLTGRELALWTESYGGHYGPTFAAYFLSQNDAIASGNVSGIPLNLKVLSIGNGLTDPLIQYPAYIQYAASNPYYPLVPQDVITLANTSWTERGGCRDQITACYSEGTNAECASAILFCNTFIQSLLIGPYNYYYVLSRSPDPYPPNITNYINSIRSSIGAEVPWSDFNPLVYANFVYTGDWMRNSRPDLERVINSGVRVLIYAGDADYILNFKGVEGMVDALNTKFSDTYKTQEFQNYTVHGELAGLFKNAGNFSYARIYGAGHEVPAYKYGSLETGEAAFQMFSQIMSNQSLYST